MMLSFIVLNYRTPHHLRICCDYLTQLNLPFEYEIIVVDNNSGDTSLEAIAAYDQVKVIANTENSGHAVGNNIGIKQAQGKYLLIVNPDIMIKSSDDIAVMVAYMESHEKTAILGPKLVNPDGSVQYSCYRQYSLLTPIYRRTFLGSLPWAKRDINRHLMTDFNHDETRAVDWVLGACMLMRSEVIHSIGGFSEDFFLYFADYELCDRVRQAGFDVVYFHDTKQIIHYHQRQSAARRFSVFQAVSYLTRRHMMDWWVYLQKRNVNR